MIRHAHDQHRLEDLRKLDLLLTTVEQPFERITRELARIFDVAYAVMSFSDDETLFVKSSFGLPPDVAAQRTEPRDEAICTQVVDTNRPLVVEDLRADDRYRDNPFVLATGARFYAGTPLRAESGRAVGTICIVDDRPRSLGERECNLLRVLADSIMAQVKLRSASQQLLNRTKQVERDLQRAVQVQRSMLPPAQIVGDSWRIDHVYRPHEHLGGDFLDVLARPDGRQAILVADVSGHGTSAALTAAQAKTAFLRAAADATGPADLLTSINRDLAGLVPPSRFITAVAAFFDPGTRATEIASAGHPYPLLIDAAGVTVVEIENGLPLLVDAAVDYGDEVTTTLDPGTRLLAYTDGAIEAIRADGSRLETEGLAQCVRQVAHHDAAAFLEALLATIGDRAQNDLHDDVALLCVASR